jgi:hypothetical protein
MGPILPPISHRPRRRTRLLDANATLQDALTGLDTVAKYAKDRGDRLLQQHIARIYSQVSEARHDIAAETAGRLREE